MYYSWEMYTSPKTLYIHGHPDSGLLYVIAFQDVWSGKSSNITFKMNLYLFLVSSKDLGHIKGKGLYKYEIFCNKMVKPRKSVELQNFYSFTNHKKCFYLYNGFTSTIN